MHLSNTGKNMKSMLNFFLSCIILHIKLCIKKLQLMLYKYFSRSNIKKKFKFGYFMQYFFPQCIGLMKCHVHISVSLSYISRTFISPSINQLSLQYITAVPSSKSQDNIHKKQKAWQCRSFSNIFDTSVSC